MAIPSQNTEEWVEWRKDKIGASDLPAIMGESKSKNEYDLYLEKMGLQEVVENPAMRKGKIFEKEVKQLLGLDDCPIPFVHAEFDWAIASLDGMKDGLIHEIKYANIVDHQAAINGKIPVQYVSQLHWQMFVCEKDTLMYVSYNPTYKQPLAFVLVTRSQVHIDKMLAKAKEFRQRLLDMSPPESKKDFRIDDEWEKEEEFYVLKKALYEQAAFEMEESKKRLISLSNGKSCAGRRISLTKSTQKGRVDYSLIPEIKGLDLEKYRGKDVERWTVNLKA